MLERFLVGSGSNAHQPARSIKQIFDHLVTEHQATEISYSMIRDNVADRRSPRPRPRKKPRIM